MNYFKKRQENRQKQINGLEGFLSNAFSPVSPSQDFISYLGERLNTYPKPTLEVRVDTLKWYQYTLLAVISIIGGGVLMAMIIRILITWVAWLGLFRQIRQESQTL